MSLYLFLKPCGMYMYSTNLKLIIQPLLLVTIVVGVLVVVVGVGVGGAIVVTGVVVGGSAVVKGITGGGDDFIVVVIVVVSTVVVPQFTTRTPQIIFPLVSTNAKRNL